VPLEEETEELRQILGYQFYRFDQLSGRAQEFQPSTTDYVSKISDLALDISRVIKDIQRAQAAPAGPDTTPSGEIVYLAETTSDLSLERDQIRRELQQYGHIVLPDRELVLRGPELQASLREYLKNSKLAIHLIGANYGIIPEGAEESVVELQYKMTAERAAIDREFKQLVWMPPGLQPSDERQQRFIARLLNDSTGAEILQFKLEDLKSLIQERLRPKPPVPKEVLDGPPLIYLICDLADQEVIFPLADFLFDQGFEALLPPSEGGEEVVFQMHKDSLLVCDAAIIYQGKASATWLQVRLLEVRKAIGYGRDKPLPTSVYLGPPASPNKDWFRSHEVQVIKEYGPLRPDLLNPFLEEIKALKIRA
jgi:hypothetical protein